MNKKGFTLVELLAVITILAVIALITTPIIFGVVEDSRMNSFTRSVEEMRNVIDMDYNEYGRNGTVTYKYSNNKLVCVECDGGSDLELDFTGEIDDAFGTFYNNDGEITLTVENGVYKATDDGSGEVVTVKK